MGRVLMDKNCTIAAGVTIGHNPEEDRKRFPFVTESGIVVLPKGTHVPLNGPIEFANDMAFLLHKDPVTKDQMKRYKDRYVVAERSRHSFDSAGPRNESLQEINESK